MNLSRQRGPSMAATTRVPVATARDIASRALRRFGTPAETADVVVARLLDADLDGHPSHGVLRIPQYCKEITAGVIAPQSRPRATRRSTTVWTVDGRRAFGALVADEVIATAVRTEAGDDPRAIGVRNSGHLGRLGYLARGIARNGHVAIGFFNCSGGGQKVMPVGGASGRLATNPIIFGCPTSDGRPVVVDVTTSASTDGRVQLAAALGETLPNGILADPEGRAVNDATRSQARPPGAFLLPLGGVAAHKGYALAVAVEILAGILGGPDSVAQAVRGSGNSGILLVLAPTMLGRSIDEVGADIAALETYLRSCSADDRQPVRLPGRRPDSSASASPDRSHVRVPAPVWDSITRLGRADRSS